MLSPPLACHQFNRRILPGVAAGSARGLGLVHGRLRCRGVASSGINGGRRRRVANASSGGRGVANRRRGDLAALGLPEWVTDLLQEIGGHANIKQAPEDVLECILNDIHAKWYSDSPLCDESESDLSSDEDSSDSDSGDDSDSDCSDSDSSDDSGSDSSDSEDSSEYSDSD